MRTNLRIRGIEKEFNGEANAKELSGCSEEEDKRT